MQNVGEHYSSGVIRPLHINGQRNGDVRIYRPDKNGKEVLVKVVPADSEEFVAMDGEKRPLQPKKRSHGMRVRKKYNCCQCNKECFTYQLKKQVRCEECQEVRNKELNRERDRKRRAATSSKNAKYGMKNHERSRLAKKNTGKAK